MPFARTLRSLHADGAGPRLPVLAAGLLLAGWGGWFLLGQVALYELSSAARLEAPTAAHRVAAELPGRVVESHLSLGLACRAGDVLLVLDAQAERLARAEKASRLTALARRRQAVGQEIEAEEAALAASRKARSAALEELKAQAAEAEAKSGLAEAQRKVSERLARAGGAAELELRKSIAEAEATRASARAARAGLERAEWDRQAQESDRLTRLRHLHTEAATLDGEAAVEQAAAERLDHEIARRTVRAPVDGRIAAVEEVRPGTVLEEAQGVATLVPEGRPRVVAFFPPRGVGRLRAGQAARVHLEGFPRTQYGALAARVAEVGQEPLGGAVRVELAVDPGEDGRLPLEHGATAHVEVEVERVSPAGLVLRAAGEWLTRQRFVPPAVPPTTETAAGPRP